MYTTRFLDVPPLAARRHGAPARLEEHLEPGAAAGRPRRGHDGRRRPAGLRRHPSHARGARRARLRDRARRRDDASRASAAGPPVRGRASSSATPAPRCGRSPPRSPSSPRRDGRFELRGVARMHERPIGDLVDALRGLGCGVDYPGRDGFPPLRVGAAPGRFGSLAPIRVRGDVSSQFLTALLLALPLATASAAVDRGRRRADLEPYVDLTLACSSASASRSTATADGASRSPPGSRYRSPGALASRATPRRRRTSSPPARSPPAARRCASTASAPTRCRATSASSTPRARWARRSTAATAGSTCAAARLPLRADRVDCEHFPDAAMTLAVLALFADGTDADPNIASWRLKETDRLAAMATELRKLGARS